MPIDILGKRIQDLAWSDNLLWGTITIQNLNGETTAYWFKLETNSTGGIIGVADQGPIEADDIGEGTFTYYPSVAVNNNRIAAFGFSASSESIFVGAYATVRDDKSDPAGTVQSTQTVRPGEGPTGRSDWGLFSSMANDPVDEECFWVYNAYSSNVGQENLVFASEFLFDCWGTAWARL